MDNILTDYKAQIDQTLNNLIPPTSPLFHSLYEGARYSLLAPGKRIRPLLTVCTAEMIKPGALQAALIPACALEMVHTYSLIHDDLPCMDDDDFRRGLPTLHRVYTEGHAVLAGDYLLTHAFESLSTSPLLNPEQKIELVRVLAQTSGGEGMIGGQIMDIEQSSDIQEMHARKTGALFCAAVVFGGIVAKASPETLQLLHTFGLQFGNLFQILDDISDEDHPLGNEKAKESAFELHKKTLETLDLLSFDSSSLTKLIELVVNGNQSFTLHTCSSSADL